MKSTANNATWVSQTFKQEATDSNWLKADVKMEEGFSPIALAQETQTSTSVKILRGLNSITTGDAIRLYNSTDGATETTAVLGANSVSDGQTDFNVSVAGETLFINNSSTPNFNTVFGGTGNLYGGYTLYNEDGTKLYRLGRFTAGIRAFSLTTPYNPSDGMSFLGTSQLTESTLPTQSYAAQVGTNYHNWAFNYLPGGKEMVVWFSGDREQFGNYEIYTLATPYDPTTASLKKAYVNDDVNKSIQRIAGQLLYDWRYTISTSNADHYQRIVRSYGISQIQFNEDGTRVFIGRHGANASQLISYSSTTFYAHHYFLNLATPYDITSANGISVVRDDHVGTSTSNFPQGALVSNDGGTIYSVYRNSNGYMFGRAITLSVGGWGGTIATDNSSVSSISTTTASSYFVSESSNWSYSTDYVGEMSPTFIHGGKRLAVYSASAYKHSLNPEQSNMWANGYIDLDISGDSQTAPPESINTPNAAAPTASILAGTKNDLDKIGKSLLVTPDSSTTSLVMFGDDFYGNDAITTGSPLVINGVEATSGTVTKTSDYMSSTFTGYKGGPTTEPSLTIISELMRNVNASGGTFSSFDGRYNIGPENWENLETSNYDHSTRFAITPDGKTLYTNAYPTYRTTTNAQFAKHTLSTPFDIGTAQYVSTTGAFTAKVPVSNGNNSINNPLMSVSFNADGTRLNAISSTSSLNTTQIQSYPLTTPYDLDSGGTADYGENCRTVLGDNGQLIMKHTWTDDGAICFFVKGYNTSYWINDNYTTSIYWASASTPFDARTLSSMTYVDGGTGYTADVVAAGTYNNGYRLMRIGFGATSQRKVRIYSFKGDMSSDSDQEIWNHGSSTTTYANQPFGLAYDSDSNWAGHLYGLLKSPQSDKIYHFKNSSGCRAMQFTFPWGFFEDKYVVDVTSAGLVIPPSSVTIGNPTFDSLGTPTVTEAADKTTYTYPSKSIDVEAMRLKVTANSGADVQKLDVDLYK
jgi:hypothetical protein